MITPFTLYTSLGYVMNGSTRNKSTFDLRFRGVSIGNIIVEKDEVKVKTKIRGVKKSLNLKDSDLPNLKFDSKHDWGNDEIKSLRSRFKNFELEKFATEHEMEAYLLNEFSKKGKD